MKIIDYGRFFLKPVRNTEFYRQAKSLYYHWEFLLWQRKLNRYTFINRQKGASRLCYILAGYKPYLWEIVFARLEKFLPKNTDVCIVSSGIFHKTLKKIAKKNHWSYLATRENQICNAQNLVIRLHPHAEEFYKMDEDIFVTKGVFRKMKDAFTEAQTDKIQIGFVGAQSGLNPACFREVLSRLNLLEKFQKIMGKTVFDLENYIDAKHEAAEFFCGKFEEGKIFRDIDRVAEFFAEQDLGSYASCGMNYSVGMILFQREWWEQMGNFPVEASCGLGQDGNHLISFALIHPTSPRRNLIARKTYVSHYSSALQNEYMEEYFRANRKQFPLPE